MGMLRITRHSSNGFETLQLEGRLSGPCVGELKRVADDSLLQCAGLRLDLAELDFVDASGAALLRELVAADVTLLGCSRFMFELLKGSGCATPGARLPAPSQAAAVARSRP